MMRKYRQHFDNNVSVLGMRKEVVTYHTRQACTYTTL